MTSQTRQFVSIIAALSLAILAGAFTRPESSLGGVSLLSIYDTVGRLFLNALMLVVVPLVVSSMITGMARMGSEEAAGSLGKRAFTAFALTAVIAVFIACMVALTLQPGVGTSKAISLHSSDTSVLVALEEEGLWPKMELLLFKLIPSNILAAAMQGQMLGLLPFCLVFGYCLAGIESHTASIMIAFWRALFQVCLRMTRLILKVLPIGVFGLVAKATATLGLEGLQSVLWFTASAFIAFGIYGLIALPLLLKCYAHVSPLRYARALAPALITAFSTSSSSASLPALLECVEQRAGISNRIAGFALPLGGILNLTGTALYQCLAVLFLAQVYGLTISFSLLALTALTALLFSVGMAGIPSACLVAIALILPIVGVPAEGIGLLLALERILDMFRTATNVWGNACCTLFLSVAEGENPAPLQQGECYDA